VIAKIASKGVCEGLKARGSILLSGSLPTAFQVLVCRRRRGAKKCHGVMNRGYYDVSSIRYSIQIAPPPPGPQCCCPPCSLSERLSWVNLFEDVVDVVNVYRCGRRNGRNVSKWKMGGEERRRTMKSATVAQYGSPGFEVCRFQ